MIKLSISLVTYKPNLLVLATVLSSLAKSLIANNITAILYLVDNSCDVEWHEKVNACLCSHFDGHEKLAKEFVISPSNAGYGSGNNIAIDRISSSDYHLVINPDLFVTPETFSNAVQYMEQNPDVGLLTPAIFGEDGEQHFLCKKNPTLFDMYLRTFAPSFLQKKFAKRMAEFEMRDQDYSKNIENVGFPSGCFMFFRTTKLKQAGGFDPAFFMYYEDADIGRRLSKIAKVVYVPEVKVIHKWARGTRTSLKLKWIAVKSGITYWRKWGGIS